MVPRELPTPPLEVPNGNGFSVLEEGLEGGLVLGGIGGGVGGRNLSVPTDFLGLGLNESPLLDIPEQKLSEGRFLHVNSLIEDRRT